MSYTKIIVHLVWSTKNRESLINDNIKRDLLNHIKENSIKKEIFIDTINCISDHIHLLISLGTDQTISKVVQLIKGESSHWVNSLNIVKNKFEWQDDYFAMSISQSIMDRVRHYIDNQEEHHRRKSYIEECEEIMNQYGFKNNQ
ncbi:MAG: IS200/IS605 family transposase [Ignavibacteriaceae bacterium]|jgi:REP element-mobilizing transposase RayT